MIVAVEPDGDDSRRGSSSRRIDQGFLDASRESHNHVLQPPVASDSGKSWWWSSLSSSPSATITVSPTSESILDPLSKSSPILGAKTDSKATPNAGVARPVALKHRRTVSYNKTYRVP